MSGRDDQSGSTDPKCAYVGPCPYCHRVGWTCEATEGWVGHWRGDPNFVHLFVPPKEQVNP